MKLTKNFNLREFASKDGSPTPQSVIPNIQELANNLQVLRDCLNLPITINSGYRSAAHNKAVGGAKNSQHLTASGADINAKNYTPDELAAYIEGLIESGEMKQGGLKAYKGFVHYDIRGTKARW